MAKYYIKCGTLELIYSCDKAPRYAAMHAIVTGKQIGRAHV